MSENKAKAVSPDTEIYVTVGPHELKFLVNSAKYGQFLNGVTANNKISPARNLLTTCVTKESRAALHELLADPLHGSQYAMLICDAVDTQFKTPLEVQMGKSNASPAV